MNAIQRGKPDAENPHVRLLMATAVATLVQMASSAEIGFKFEANHADCLYKVGEECVLTVTATNGAGEAVQSGTCRIEIDNYGSSTYQVIASQDFAVQNPFVLRAAPTKPGFVRFRLSGRDAQNVSFSKMWGVGFDPQNIRPGSARPTDFDAFWDAAVTNFAATVPIDAQMVLNATESASGTHDCYELTFATVPTGRKIRGQLSIPKAAGRYPVTMNVPGAGSGSWGWQRPTGRCYLTLNVLDYPHRPNGDVAALYADQNERWSAKSGLTNDKWYFVGDLSKGREDYFYYGAILGINRAVDWVAALDKVDVSDFRYEGQSQGGAFGIYLSALNRHITRAQISEPALTDLSGELTDGRQSGWPQLISRTKAYPTLNENVKAIAPYFDCAHFVPRITIPTRWNVGFVDELCPPAAVWAGYNCLCTYDKLMNNYPGLGHGTPSALYQAATRETTESWNVKVPVPASAAWIDAKVSAYPEGELTTRTVESARGWGNWVGTDFSDKAAVEPAGTVSFEADDDPLAYAGTAQKDLASFKLKGVEVRTSFARFDSYTCDPDDLPVPENAKAALTVCQGNFYALAAQGEGNGWTLLAPAGAFAGAEVAVKVVIADYADGLATVSYSVGATLESLMPLGTPQTVRTDAVVSGVAFAGCGALTALEGDGVRHAHGMQFLIAARD